MQSYWVLEEISQVTGCNVRAFIRISTPCFIGDSTARLKQVGAIPYPALAGRIRSIVP